MTAKTAVLFTRHISTQKNSCLYFLSDYCFLYPVVKSTTFRYGVPFAQAARFSPAIRMIRSNVSGHMRRDHKVLKLPQRAVRRKRFRLRNIETTAAEMSIF